MKNFIIGVLVILLFVSVCSGGNTPWYKPANNLKTNIFYRWLSHAIPVISEKIKPFDITKAKTKLNWRPPFSLEYGVAETVRAGKLND